MMLPISRPVSGVLLINRGASLVHVLSILCTYINMVCFIALFSSRNNDNHQRIARAPNTEAAGSSFDAPQSSETHAAEPLGKL